MPKEYLDEKIKIESQTFEKPAEHTEDFFEVEKTIEKNQQEDESKGLGDKIENLKSKLKKQKKKPTQVPIIRDEMTLKIEKIMEEGLGDAYQELTPVQKQEFKIKGEETAYKIRQLLKGTRIKIKQIFKLILEWLKFLPGVNHFFLEQEAKIKTDKILSIKR